MEELNNGFVPAQDNSLPFTAEEHKITYEECLLDWEGLTSEEIVTLGLEALEAKDGRVAAFAFKRATELKNVSAEYNLALCYEKGVGVEKDPAVAFTMMKRLADFDRKPIAQYRVGTYYQQGFGIEKNVLKAAEYYMMAAEEGNAFAAYYLAMLYENGALAKDDEEIFNLYLKAAGCGIADANVNIGNFYLKGIYVQKDIAKAIEYYEKAGASAYAYTNIGLAYKEPDVKDYEKAFSYFKKAAEMDFAQAWYLLALCFANGTGTKKNPQKTLECLENAARKGYPLAQYELAKYIITGVYKQQDPTLAMQLLSSAAKKGVVDAQYLIGRCYMTGFGVQKDEKKALKCFGLAAKQNNAEAFWQIALCYLNGLGVEKDVYEGKKFALKAVVLGNETAKEYCIKNGWLKK